MTDVIGWAARYQFLDELWRGQDRIIFDPALEGSLRVGGAGVGHGSHEALADLSDALLPREDAGENVWVALSNPRRGAEYSRYRPGTTFVGLDEAASIAADEDWAVAIVDVAGMVADESTLRSVAPGTVGVEARLDPRLTSFVEVLSEVAESGRSVVLSVPSGDADGLDYTAFANLAASLLPAARIYGVGGAAAAMVYDFGPLEDDDDEDEDYDDDVDGEGADYRVGYDADADYDEDGDSYDADLDAAEAEWTTPGGIEPEDLAEESFERDGADEEVPIDYDNSLGDAEPQIVAWLAVASVRPLSEGLTVLELPAGTTGAPGTVERDDSQVRAQLEQVQRQADLAAIERQRLLEQLEEAEDRIASLTDEREHLLDGAAEVAELNTGAPPSETVDAEPSGERLDAVLAREQALRWELEQVRAELENVRARPVSELEADVARLEALAAGKSTEPVAGPVAPNTKPREPAAPQPMPARSDATARLRGEVDRLLRRIERGGLPSLELHRELSRLRRALGR